MVDPQRLKKIDLSRLDRPPAVQNWVRNCGTDVDEAAFRIVQFLLHPPTTSYAAVQRVVRDIIEMGLDPETALRAIETRGAPNSRKINKEVLEAFLIYEASRGYLGLKRYDQVVATYQIGRDALVPVIPLSIVIEHGRLVPIFLVGWSKIPLNDFQRRLLMSVLEDALFSLSDFEGCKGEILFFPKEGAGGSGVRKAEVWERGDYTLLSKAELKEATEQYMQSRARARLILADMIAAAEAHQGREEDRRRDHPNPDQRDLFRK